MKRCITIPFVQMGDRLCARLSEEHFAAEMVLLEVRTRADVSAVVAAVEDRTHFRLGPESQVEMCVPGLPLSVMRQPPPELNPSPNSVYFIVDARNPAGLWESIWERRTLALSCAGGVKEVLNWAHVTFWLHLLLPEAVAADSQPDSADATARYDGAMPALTGLSGSGQRSSMDGHSTRTKLAHDPGFSES